MRRQSTELKSFLFQHLYRHPQVTQTMDMAKRVVRELFDVYVTKPQEMQAGFASRTEAQNGVDSAPHRVVADYIAGMTDRFAAREHERLTGQRLLA
jgi:dGTPase